ncbi:hypothetical protein GALMADRAFT_218826 [Galerina marginata CBS 339.88]|uniref:Lethal giant larvae (Lgl)-like C-terminal domain-containing protein n=1 Tax=Galerina marginata (strain CBS 339.88) TaxID=685588 RepID=A0A067TRB3_GALM3|nr:hypothetical protein GALMADRAFT_218826 [Galerina marginata CBS 339.88]
MFSKHNEHTLPDLSTDLRDEQDWRIGSLRTLDFPLNVTTLAIEPIAGLLAAGTADGVINIFGNPGIHCKITLPQPVEVRLLQFSTSTFNIVCLDKNSQLHVYSLLEFGKPKLVTSARFDQCKCVFVATQNGDIKTYDLTCLRKSPYSTPNLWKLYEEKLEASGIPSLIPPAPPNAVDTVIHPRNLDLVFVAYAGGVVLTGLTERSTIRAYELVLSPGAPGGTGYGADDILTHRRPMVTSIATHPSGHFFAVGYADGSVAIWAVEDDSKPLLVRTLDTVDVNLVDASMLETKGPKSVREPIFKLSWSSFANSSDPRGGDTALAILGGLDAGKPPGLTVFLLPAFNPSAPPPEAPAPQDSLHPFFRGAMRQSLTPKKSFFYETGGVVQDYLLIPHTSPHFAGNFDPRAILFITECQNLRTVEAYQYPPPGFIQASPAPAHDPVNVEDEEQEEENTTGLLSPPPPPPLPKSPRHLNHTPLPLRTPVPLLCGHSGIVGGRLFRVSNEIYQDFIDKNTTNDLNLSLKGGQAFADVTKANELKLSKYQPHRLVMTYNRNLTVQFFDISTQLLIPSPTTNLLEHEWPEPLPALSIGLNELFDDSTIAGILASPVDQIAIHSAQVAPEALECAMALKSGEVIVYHQSSSRSGASSPKVLGDTEILLLDHIRSPPGSRLTPYFIFAPGKGPVEAYVLSDIGFLAVSYKDGSMFIVDMRGPKIIFSQQSDKRSKRTTLHAPHLSAGHGPGPDVVQSLTWTISSLDNDPQVRVRLIAAHQSGQAEIFTLIPSGNPVSWGVAGDPVSCKAVPDPIPDGTFVLDSKGTQCKADRARFAASFKGVSPSRADSGPKSNTLLTVGANGARCSLNLNGEKVAKVEWGHKVGAVRGAHVVQHMDSRVLVVQTDRHDALIYSIPHLEPLSIDDSGDYIAWKVSSKTRSSGVIESATYGTFFDVRRAYTLPDIDFAISRGPIPPQPQPVSLGPASVLGSWFSFNQTKSGAQIDDLLGGPNRPIPEKVDLGEASGEGVTASASGAAAGLVAGAAAVQANLYNRLTSAMNERGQLLGDLEERFNSLEEGSRGMLAQAKRLATQQTAKSWFGL